MATDAGVRTSSRAVAGGRKAGKPSSDPTDLFTHRFSNHCARREARIFDKKHATFLFAKPRHDRASEGCWRFRIGFTADQQQRTVNGVRPGVFLAKNSLMYWLFSQAGFN